MDTLKKVLYKCLMNLDCDFSKFQLHKCERIKFQKYCYLLKKTFSLPLNGAFSLYLNGPYNARLADDLYDIAKNQDDYIGTSPEDLKETTITKLNTLRNIFQENDPPISEIDLLELYTTYDYLNENYPSLSNEERIQELKKRKQQIFAYYPDPQNIINIVEGIATRIQAISA